MAADSDLAAAVVIAIAILVIALCVWPGFARVRVRDLLGYWADPAGDLYEFRAGRDDRTFVVQSALPDGRAVDGRIAGVRGLTVGDGALAGRLDLGGRRISWARGGAWIRQGVRQ